MHRPRRTFNQEDHAATTATSASNEPGMPTGAAREILLFPLGGQACQLPFARRRGGEDAEGGKERRAGGRRERKKGGKERSVEDRRVRKKGRRNEGKKEESREVMKDGREKSRRKGERRKKGGKEERQTILRSLHRVLTPGRPDSSTVLHDAKRRSVPGAEGTRLLREANERPPPALPTCESEGESGAAPHSPRSRPRSASADEAPNPPMTECRHRDGPPIRQTKGRPLIRVFNLLITLVNSRGL